MNDVYFCGDDYLGLGTYGSNIRDIIENSDNIVRSNDNASFVIGIDAPWGTGKTYFVKMLENYLCGKWKNPSLGKDEISSAEKRTGLKGKDDYLSRKRVIHYDAWSNDFWNNAFEPFYNTVINDIAGYQGVGKSEIISTAKIIGKVISIGFDTYMNHKYGDTYEAIKKSVETVGEDGKRILDGIYSIDNIFPDYVAFSNAVQKLKDLLTKTVEEFKANQNGEGMIVIVIDELDRCKPLFAVQTLEIVKHFFNIPGIVFIFTLDISQLRHCVKKVYGTEFDAEGYLERFFNYISNLPQGNYRPLIELFNNEAKKKASAWNDFSKPVISTFVEIAKRFNLSLRELKIVLSSLHLLEQSTLKKESENAYSRILYFFFLSYKYKKPDSYRQSFLKNNFESLDILLKDSTTQIPFYVYDNEAQNVSTDNDLNKNRILRDILTTNKKMCDMEMRIYDYVSAGEVARGYFRSSVGNLIKCTQSEYKLASDQTIGYLLYRTDFVDEESSQTSSSETLDVNLYSSDEKPNIFQMTPIEFLNKKLEMVDFI